MLTKEQAHESRMEVEDRCCIANKEDSKQMWIRNYGGIRGFKAAWNRRYTLVDGLGVRKAHTVEEPAKGVHIKEEDSCHLSVLPDPTAKLVTTMPTVIPEILDNETQRHLSFSIIRVQGGWCVVTYEIEGRACTIKRISDVESKQFAVNRVFTGVREQMMEME